jgi:L-ascorbate metabolism protein UlaG (beta-lactamase superfamily)
MNLSLFGSLSLVIEGESHTLILEAQKDHPSASVLVTSVVDSIKSKQARVVSWPGESEVGPFFIKGVQAENTLFRISVEGVNIVHTGKNTEISKETLSKLGSIDVLILPVEEGYLLPEQAMQLIKEVDPQIVLPVGTKKEEVFTLMGDKTDPVLKYKLVKSQILPDTLTVVHLTSSGE